MTGAIPDDAMLLTVEFATRGGGEYRQHVMAVPSMLERGPGAAISAAVRACKRKGVAVANCLRIMHGQILMYDAVKDLARRSW